MAFLGFRHAKRKAKKMVSACPPRSPTPSSSSFVTPSVVEIGDPTSASAEACYGPMTLHVDVDISREPLFASDPVLSFRQHSPPPNPKESQERLSRSRHGGNSSKPLHHNAGWVRPRDSDIAGSAVVGDVVQTQGLCRSAKPTPTPIRIPTTYHACKVEIQRPAGKPAEPHLTSLKPGESPILEDTASAVSGISLPATLIVSGWTTQTDQSRDRHLSRRITRLDSATLPVDPFLQQYSGLSNGDRECHVPPVPVPIGASPELSNRYTTEQVKGDVDMGDRVLSTGEGKSCDQLLPETTVSEVFNAYKSLPTSHIVELPTPDPSDSETPDLIKDSSTSADGGSSDAQPNTSSTSDSASSAWSGPQYSSSPASVGKITKILDVFPATPSDAKLPSQAGLPTGGRNDGSRKLLAKQRRTCATPEFRRLLSRSSSRPSLASVNVLLLHPATLRPASEHTPTHSSGRSTGSHVADPDSADSLSTLPSSLPTTCPQDISQLPSFPETAANPSAATSFGFPSSSSPPSSPDFLDGIILAEERGRTRQQRTSGESTSTMPGSGSTQTFPETPPIFSPMFSPGFGHPRGHTSSISDSSTRQHHPPLKGRSSRASQKFISGRSASAKASMGTMCKKSWRNKLKRSSTANHAPAILSSLSTATSCDTTTTMKSDLSTHPKSISSDGSSDPEYFRRPAHHERSEFTKKTLTAAPQPSSPLVTPVKPESNSTSPSLLPLPPPPPPPQLQLPLPLVSRVSAVSPSSPPCGLSPSPTTEAHPPSFNIPSEDKPKASVSLSSPTHPPPALPSVTRPYNPLAPHSTSPFRVPVNLPLSAYNTDRPPRPLGPRAPYRNESFSSGSRSLFLSNSSTESFAETTVMGGQDLVSERSSACCGSSSEPRFQTSPAKFKTLTMDAARWIFSKEELHALVSQAIRGPGRASSIRLLPQQAAFVEIPEELGRLNALLDELTVQYRLQVRKRNVLLRATLEYAESPEPCSTPFRSKLQELHETALNLDRIAEEMYHARDQVAQLSRMLAVHSGSALAMALRNLHSNYVKRATDLQGLKDHVSALEAECDEAWAQAQQVARDLDDLNSTLQTDSSPNTRHTSRSSSRIVASRQSNLRFSRMGPQSNASLRASLASPIDSTHLSYASAVSSSSSVPAITRRLSSLNRIITSGLSSQSSDLSSSSGKRALAQAQADLYKYLGIDDHDDRESLPRPVRRSFTMASPSTTMSPVARDEKEKAFGSDV